MTIPLSICLPAYNRPQWLERALKSIIETQGNVSNSIEIIVSDDSSDCHCGQIAQAILEQQKNPYQYIHNQPKLGMAANWNQGIKYAQGEYVLILHDDDFLLSGAIKKVLQAIKLYNNYSVLLWGVNVVNEQEKILKRQHFTNPHYLPPKLALYNLLSNSSLVRFPAIIIKRSCFDAVGYFNPDWGEPTDIDMWIRLFSEYGVFCVPEVTCAYTVHSQALTMGVFQQKTIETLLSFFGRVAESNLLSESELNFCRSQFFHQFICAGAFRKLRRGQWQEFHEILELFNLPRIQDLKPRGKWRIIRYWLEVIASLTPS